METDLYTFNYEDTSRDSAVFGQAIKPPSIRPKTPFISVIDNMQFVGNDLSTQLKDKIPFCILKEFELVSNSTVSQLLYYIRGFGVTDQMLSNLSVVQSDDVGKFIEGKIKSIESTNATKLQDIIGTIAQSQAGEFINNQLGNIGQAIQSEEGTRLSGVLLPFNGLYARKSTGFQYIFPYYADLNRDITTNFTESETGLLKGNLFARALESKAADKFKNIASNILMATPGAYIELPKYFSPTPGETYSFTFNLINTIDSTKIQRHLDFLFLLSFQNLPYRKNIAEILPPKIYSFTIPHQLELPYAYISRLTINFVGARRMMNMRLPYTSEIKNFIVPEAYEVTIEVTSLTNSSANFLLADHTDKVEVITGGAQPPQPTPIPLEPIPLQ